MKILLFNTIACIILSCSSPINKNQSEVLDSMVFTHANMTVKKDTIIVQDLIENIINNHSTVDSFKMYICTFIDDILINNHLGLRYYDRYFNQTSEIESIMSGANNKGILIPFQIDENNEISYTLSYIAWRLKNVGIKGAKDVLSVKEKKHYDSYTRCFIVKFKNSQIFYFVFNIEPDVDYPIIGGIYDKNEIALIPDHYIWSKMR